VELAEKLRKITPGNLGKVLYSTGGSDAIEIALKVARAATGRFKTISFWDAFHGAGFGAISVGGEQQFRSHITGHKDLRTTMGYIQSAPKRLHEAVANLPDIGVS
jgi:4-aminobutyrate aminotransferase